MQETIIPQIEPTPDFKSRKCRILVFVLMLSLTYGSFILAAAVWILYGFFYAVAALLIGYLVIGIARSMMRNSSIPKAQQEYHYTDKAIAAWYLSRTLCFGLA
jgi:hypothetical protein